MCTIALDKLCGFTRERVCKIALCAHRYLLIFTGNHKKKLNHQPTQKGR